MHTHGILTPSMVLYFLFVRIHMYISPRKLIITFNGSFIMAKDFYTASTSVSY